MNKHPVDLLVDRQHTHVLALEPEQFVRVETRRGGGYTIERKSLEQVCPRDLLLLVVERPTDPSEPVYHRVGKVAKFLIAYHSYRVRNRFWVPSQSDKLLPNHVNPRELTLVLLRHVIIQLPLRNLLLRTAWVCSRQGHIRHVRERGNCVTECIKYQPLKVGVCKMFLGTNHVCDLHVNVVDSGCEIVERMAICPDDDPIANIA